MEFLGPDEGQIKSESNFGSQSTYSKEMVVFFDRHSGKATKRVNNVNFPSQKLRKVFSF